MAANGFADQEFKARHNLACLAFVDGDLARALVLMRAADRMDAAVSRDRARLDHAEVLEPPADLTQAVEELVRATLALFD